MGNKTFDFSSKKRIFCPKATKFGPKLAFLTIAGKFGALLMGWLVGVARGLYLARHLFTLFLDALASLVSMFDSGSIMPSNEKQEEQRCSINEHF